ncbi:MAG: BACON domain-containing protein, partial [Candidatus Cryptobacteroides sp.]
MKKALLSLVALTAMICSCTKQEQVAEEIIPDEIEISQKTPIDLPNEGGSFDVSVTSSKQWTLKSDCDWIRHSACYGEDGDVVTFKVDANNSTTARKADITFVVGKESAKFTVKQGEGASLEIE